MFQTGGFPQNTSKIWQSLQMVSQSGSEGYWIMGKTADFTDVQRTVIDTLHKKGKL